MTIPIKTSMPSLPTPSVVRQAGAAAINPGQDKQSTQATQAAPSTPPSEAEISQAIEELQSSVETMGHNNLSFRREDAINRSIIVVRDSETDEIIREIPSEEIVAMARRIEAMTANATSLLVDNQA